MKPSELLQQDLLTLKEIMSDLDLVDWTRVARAVTVAECSLRGQGYKVEPSEAGKAAAYACVQESKEGLRLRAAGFTHIGGYWCRIEDGKIAPYARESAIRRLEKEDA